LNQPAAAEKNFQSFCTALRPLLTLELDSLRQLDEIQSSFASVMQLEMEKMWAAKLGLNSFNKELFSELISLMMQTSVDYTIFFRELSSVPDNIEPLKKSFYQNPHDNLDLEQMNNHWSEWLTKWKAIIGTNTTELSRKMKRVNPKYSLREWFVVPAYQQAAAGDYTLLRELQEIMTQPYDEQSKEVEDKYYRLKPSEFFEIGGISHYSCSS
jgi:uncharacterized protein YdiU (UPF0061 family)